MDEFLGDIYTQVFKQWIFLQEDNIAHFQLSEKDDSIMIDTLYSQGKISFYELNIIEFSVINNRTERIEFYLHFQMKNIKHAVELFNEMLETVEKLMEKPILKVLMSCTGGLTTTYFAERINEVAELLDMDIKVDAVGYNNLYKEGVDYDVIMLAPQISYMRAKVCEILKDKIIIKIPPAIFAKYDVKGMLALIEAKRNHTFDIPSQIQRPVMLKNIENSHAKILCIYLIRNSQRVHIGYRLFDEKNKTLADNEIIKKNLSIQDYYDVIDSMIAQYPDIKIIGLSTPGIIRKGHIESMNINGVDNISIEKDFCSRYKQKFVFCNDANATALGYYASEGNCSSLSFVFQPLNSLSGVGNVINNQLWVGHQQISGEVQFLPLNYSKNVLELHPTPEGAIEAMAKTLTSIISLIDPELIVFCCMVITDINELKKELEKYIPKEYIPRIEKIDYLQEYTLFGTLMLCIQSLVN